MVKLFRSITAEIEMTFRSRYCYPFGIVSLNCSISIERIVMKSLVTGDPEAPTKRIVQMSEDQGVRKRSVAWGLERYRIHYCCEAYARSIAQMLGIN